HLRPDLKIVTLRGSVQTRLKKLEDGAIDATFLAIAGLNRLSLAGHVTSLIDDQDMPPAPGQGALAITSPADASTPRALLPQISAPGSEVAPAAERGFLEALDGSCRTPIGALAKIKQGHLAFIGEILSPDGAKRWRREETILLGDAASASALGRKLGAAIRAE